MLSVATACVALVATVAIIAPGVAGQEIFVPTPRGAGETLDNSAASSGGGGEKTGSHKVATSAGDIIRGYVSSMNDELLVLSSKDYPGGIKVRSAAVSSIDFGTAEEAGQDEVMLNNGDRLMGRIMAVAPDHVLLQAQTAEPLKISRAMVKGLSFSAGSSILFRSDFENEKMEPWTKIRGGNYSIEDGALVSTNSGNHYPIAAPLKQTEAITFVTKFKSLDHNGPYVSICLFVDDTSGGSYGRNSIMAMFNGNSYYAHSCINGSTNQIGSGNTNNSNIQEGELRVSYDPKSKTLTMWVDKQKLGEFTGRAELKSGNHIMLMSLYRTQFSDIAVLRGIVPPTGDSMSGSEEKRDVVTFKNKDRMAVESLQMADGEFLLVSSYGELKCPAASVDTVAFRTEGAEEPRRNKNDIRIHTPLGQMVAQFKGLTEEFLIGETSATGEFKMLRKGLQKVEFNIYRNQ